MMSIVSKSILILRKAAALMLLPLLAWSCQLVTDDFDDETANISNATQYINITISVSASESSLTRAPQGGEYGDGWENGIDTRENEVDGVTLIFYQDAPNTTAGINATTANATATKIDYAVYYTVSRDDDHVYAHPTGHTDEVFYTTGDQELTEPLSSDNDYHLLVVANADLTQGSNRIIPGTTTLAQVRDMTLSGVYSVTDIGNAVTKFVMTSEEDCILDFNYSTYDKALNRRTFQLDCIHMERMAARIDYWTENSNGYKTSYTTPGYEYTVKKPNGTDSEDRFVLTSITPFNLNMGTTGNEYIFKRTNDATNPYLADETTTNWVTDPYTSGKNAASHPGWMVSTLTSVVSNLANDYNITMASQQEQGKKLSIGNKDDIIIAYPKENTLRPDGDSPLYYYATGLAFEGYYYRKGTGTGERRVYYHFIRHQGEKETAYDAWTADNIDNAKTTYCTTTTAMNFGIVRNNIYRISVNQVTDGGMLQLRIAVHDWRNVEHPTIYI